MDYYTQYILKDDSNELQFHICIYIIILYAKQFKYLEKKNAFGFFHKNQKELNWDFFCKLSFLSFFLCGGSISDQYVLRVHLCFFFIFFIFIIIGEWWHKKYKITIFLLFGKCLFVFVHKIESIEFKQKKIFLFHNFFFSSYKLP